MTSYISYTEFSPSSLSSRAPDVAFHPALWEGAMHRIARHMCADFKDIPVGKRLFLLRLVRGLQQHKRAQRAYSIIIESFGYPLFHIRNLAHTLQDPEDRMVYILHLEDLYQHWRTREETCWTPWDCACFVGFFGALIAIAVMGYLQTPIPPQHRAHPFMHLYEPPHM